MGIGIVIICLKSCVYLYYAFAFLKKLHVCIFKIQGWYFFTNSIFVSELKRYMYEFSIFINVTLICMQILNYKKHCILKSSVVSKIVVWNNYYSY